MTDKELLELAANAAGNIEYFWTENGNLVLSDPDGKRWNPLTDDGDALRLAAKLGLLIDVGPVSVAVHKSDGQRDLGFEFYKVDDPYAATRRAIVRAAAAIRKLGEQ